MVSVNLMSPSAVLARSRRRRVRRWALVVAGVAAIVAIPVGVDVVKTARGAALERQTAPILTRLEAVRARHGHLAAKCTDLAAQIARADALRAKRDWAGLLSVVTRTTPGEVWLTTIATRMPATADRARPGGGGNDASAAPEVVRLDGPRGIEITGYALDHEWLYEFMSNLKRERVFKSVELTQAGREPVLRGVAVRFVLECDW